MFFLYALPMLLGFALIIAAVALMVFRSGREADGEHGRQIDAESDDYSALKKRLVPWTILLLGAALVVVGLVPILFYLTLGTLFGR
jgi:uncharacterized membrane protein